MATENVAPNSDITTEWSYSGAGDHYTGVDEDISSPAADGDISTGDIANQERFGLVNPTFSGVCTSIRVGAHGINTGQAVTVRLFNGAAQIGSDKTVTFSAAGWTTQYTDSWAGLSYADSDLTNLAVEFEVTDYYTTTIRTVTVEITYSVGPTEVSEINDVANANIGEINDVNWAAVSEVNDVS
jgi:hypothetical protein